MLGLDAAPTTSFLEKGEVPEAVYKQHKLIQEQSRTYSRLKNSKVLKHRFRITNSRRLREKNTEPEEDEHIRFNSSITKEITLISKVLSDDTPASWCSENTHNSYNELLTPLSCFKFNLENDAFKTNIVHVSFSFFYSFF